LNKLESPVLFDVDFYAHESGQTFASKEQAIAHFLSVGQDQGFDPSPFFMWSWVRGQIGKVDLARYLSGKPKTPPHPLLKFRRVEDMAASRNWVRQFTEWVVGSDLAELVPEEFLGEAAARLAPHRFFWNATSATSQEPLETPFFSSRWYRIAYRDVSETRQNPLRHYLLRGWREGRDPSPRFSTASYLDENPDVGERQANPLLHYINFRRREGRAIAAARDYESIVRYQTLTGEGPRSYVPFEGVADVAAEGLTFAEGKKLVVVVPFYKREDLVATVLGSLILSAEDLSRIGTVVVLVNDSPDHAALDDEIASWFPALERAHIDTLYFCNSSNRGFVYSSNCGMWVAEQLGAHCLLLNSDTVIYPGAIREMFSVLLADEKFGFVNPRTNNATIATYGAQALSPEEGFAAFARSHKALPRYRIVPVAVGFCLLIRAEMIRHFGYLDAVYGMGYNEENDYIMRANRRGWSPVLANHAFVAHLGKASFSVLCDNPDDVHYRNEAVFLARYPEFKPAILRYFSSSRYHAQRLIERRNDVDILFDIRTAMPVKNGTTRLICALLPFLIEALKDYRIGVAASAEALDFHEIDLPANVRLLLDDEEATNVKAGLGFLFSQPFAPIVFDRLAYVSEKVGVFLLDSIATDCLYLQRDGLQTLWERVCRDGDLFIYNSHYTMDRFAARFAFHPEAIQVASEHSLDPQDYVQPGRRNPARRRQNRTSVLIFGNHFEHKGLAPALDALAGENLDVVVFGAELARPGVTAIAGGQIPDDELADLLASCDVLLFPSFYEGFGFPVMEALAARKPVVLLDSELNRALRERLGSPASLFFFEDFRRLGDSVRAASAFRGPWPDPRALADEGWRRSAQEIAEGMRKALARPTRFADLERRLSAIL
jgi:GT2 family glycosyltransferase